MQGGELGHDRAREPGEPVAGAREAEGTGFAEADGDGHAGEVGAVRRAEPDHEGLGMVLAPLPEPGARTEGGEQDGGRVGPGVGGRCGAGGAVPGTGAGPDAGVRVRGGGGGVDVVGRELLAAAGQTPGPCAEPAAAATAGGRGGRRRIPRPRVRSVSRVLACASPSSRPEYASCGSPACACPPSERPPS